MNAKRIRDYGITIGSYPIGQRNSITDVKGITVGHCTIDTDQHKTGVTVIIPRPENIFENKLAAASYVLNGFGKSTGLLQIDELGALESPIALTNTLNVGLVQDALVTYTVNRCREEGIPLYSYNPVVGECNDCHLNDIQERAVREEHVLSAIANASEDFCQGDVGAGKGTICYGLKGGIGSSSRTLHIDGRSYTVGILVQSNFGRTEDLIINGMAIGKSIKNMIEPATTDKGSIISVLATDIPLSSRQIGRLLKRIGIGLARTGSHIGHGSGDIMIGFSTANTLRHSPQSAFSQMEMLNENMMDELFRVVIETEEEAVLNSMIAADTVIGFSGETRYGLSPFLEEYLKQNNGDA